MEGARAAVLVVDDDDDLREWLARELGRVGFSVQSAGSGREALQVATRQRFDVALIDLRMPGMDGIATLTALKERDPDLEAVMASGQGTIPDAVSALKKGAYDFIQKPYTLRDLVPVLERALEKAHLQGVVALHEASNVLLSLHGEQELVAQTAELVHRLFRVTSFALVLLRPEPVVVGPADASSPVPQELVVRLAVKASKEGELRFRVGLGQTVDLSPYCSAVATPLRARDAEIGSLVMLRDSSLPVFTEEEGRRAEVFADQLALALDNARLHAELLARIDEVTRTRDALIFTEKLAMAGQLAAGVAHEIKNPLAFVLWNLDYILETTTTLANELEERRLASVPPLGELSSAPGDEELRATIEELRKAASEAKEGVLRIRSIAADLSQLARPQNDERTVLDLRKVVDWAINVAMPQLRPRAKLVREFQEVPLVVGSEARLGQVFVNLLVNAAQAIEPDHPSRNQVTVRLFVRAGFVVAEVQDSGSGIAPAQLGQLFEPFFTTKAAGTGTGLGLTISRGIVEAHGGQITVESTPGQGSAFRVTLPVAPSA